MIDNLNLEKLEVVDDKGKKTEISVISITKISGTNYLLVTEDSDINDADAFILKEVSPDGDDDVRFDLVVDDKEFEIVTKVFSEMLDDVDFEIKN